MGTHTLVCGCEVVLQDVVGFECCHGAHHVAPVLDFRLSPSVGFRCRGAFIYNLGFRVRV